jgi:hypothetical protein
MKPAALLRPFFLVLAGVTLAWGAYAVWRYGWRDLYADPWRLYPRFLTLPFPDNVLFLENGHRPVVPNLLRVFEIRVAAGNQVLQWAVGLAFAVLTVVVGWAILLRDRTLSGLDRAACALALSLAVFWLANSRMLMHPNESVHTYLITLLVAVAALVAAPAVAEGARIGRTAIAVCAICGFLATFSFGPGLALFVALAVVLAIVHAPGYRIVFIVASMLVTLAAYFALPGGQGVSGVLKLQPLANLRVAAQWLASPIMYLLLPFLDGNLAAVLPGELLRRVALWTSGSYAAHFGDVWHSVWPQAAIGAAGIAALLLHSVERWRRRDVASTAFAGLLFAWFGLGVAGVVALSRLAYFEVYPDQVYANRYLPWPCLFWAGLVLVALGHVRTGLRVAGSLPRRLLLAALAFFALSALVSNPNWMGWARDTQTLARHQATAVLTDVYAATLVQGETVPAELHAGVPAVRAARVALFAHPAAGRLGSRLVEAPAGLFAPHAAATARPFVSDAGVAALEIAAPMPAGYPRVRADYWVLTDDEGVVVGYAHFEPLDSGKRLAGFVRAAGVDGHVRAYPWLRDTGPGEGIELRFAPPAAH